MYISMTILQPSSVEDLGNILLKNNVDPLLYWKWKAKDLEDLFMESQEWESILYINEDTYEIIREVHAINADVLYEHPTQWGLELYEQIQVFRIKPWDDLRYRIRETPAAMMEKHKSNESAVDSMIRWMKEELRIDVSSSQYREALERSKNLKNESPSFPWIQTIYKIKSFDVLLNDEQFHPWWYVENQEKKSTIFKWRKR